MFRSFWVFREFTIIFEFFLLILFFLLFPVLYGDSVGAAFVFAFGGGCGGDLGGLGFLIAALPGANLVRLKARADVCLAAAAYATILWPQSILARRAILRLSSHASAVFIVYLVLLL